MVRNKQYSFLANQGGGKASFTRYDGPFDGRKLNNSAITKTERALKKQFEATIARLAKTRLSTASEKGRIEGLKNKTTR